MRQSVETPDPPTAGPGLGDLNNAFNITRWEAGRRATYTANVLPAFWRFLNHFWIGAETVNAERGILYFDGQDVGTELLKLLAWTAVIAGLLLLPVSRKLEHRRERPVESGALRPGPRRVAGAA